MNIATNKYTWVPVFKAITHWLKGNSSPEKQKELIQLLEKIGVDNGLKDQKYKGTRVPLEQIDPFTFYSLLIKFGTGNRQLIINKLIDEIGLDVPHLSDFDGVPSVHRRGVRLFPYAYEREDDSIELLWELFLTAGQQQVSGDLFNKTLEIKHVGLTKLTQNLFYAYPELYFPIDAQTEPWLEQQGIKVPASNWSEYKSCLESIQTEKSDPFYALSYQAWAQNQKKEQSAQNEAIVLDQYQEEKNMPPPLNQILYGPPGTGKTYRTVELAVQITVPQKYANLEKEFEGDKKQLRKALKEQYDLLIKEGRIAFTTFHQSYSYEDFIEGIRARTNEETAALTYEVQAGIFKNLCTKATDEDVMQKHTLSTDVDYSTRKIWKMSLGNTQKQKESSDIYEDSIENNRVLLGWGWLADFSDCDTYEKVKSAYLLKHPKPQEEYYCNFAINTIYRFINELAIGDLIVISYGNQAFNAIGEITTEYKFIGGERENFVQSRGVRWIKTYKTARPIQEIYEKLFSQQALYRLNSNHIRWEALNTLLTVDERNVSQQNYVMIIDEINRGNISAILGELITLLEEDKRAGAADARSATLPYSKKPFFVPQNIYIIGTMNTADKSLTQLDLALRRRFSFIEMLPDPSLLQELSVYGINMGKLLETINARIEVLLGHEYQIGHSYFMPLMECSNESERVDKLAEIFKQSIIPLLQEYFYDDLERIQWALYGKEVRSSQGLIANLEQETKNKSIFDESVRHKTETFKRYRLNLKALGNEESYQSMLPTDENSNHITS